MKGINQLLNYQEGAVVSREVIKKDAGNVTVFAFDIGQGLSEHTTSFDALVIVTEGQMKITLNGEENLLETNDYLIMPAGSPHKLQALKPGKMVLVMIKG